MDYQLLNIFVINLDRRRDRWDTILPHLREVSGNSKTFSTNIHRVQAVDRPDNPGLGCLLSHVAALQRAQDMCLPYFLVLEDDARLREPFESSLRNLLAALGPTNWSVAFLGPGRAAGVEPAGAGIMRLGGGAGAYLTGTHGLLFNGAEVHRVLGLLKGAAAGAAAFHHIDLLLSQWERKTSIFVAVPYLAEFTRTTVSDIRGDKTSLATVETDYELLLQTEQKLQRVAMEDIMQRLRSAKKQALK